MSRIRLVLGLLAVAAALGLAVWAAFRGRPSPVAPPAAPPPKVLDSDDVKRIREEAEKVSEAQRAVLDKDARGLLASCDARVYRPSRDAALQRAAGRIGVKAGDKEASYRFSFDTASPPDKPVKFETVSEPSGWDPAVTADVRRWGVMACVSAYELVAYYRPPIQLGLLPSLDGKNKIVVAPPFRTPLNVSYSFNADQLIVVRGEWTDETHKFVTNYEWEQRSGRHLLRGTKVHEGATTSFEYEERGNLFLLRNVVVKDRTPPVAAQFTFETIERRTN